MILAVVVVGLLLIAATLGVAWVRAAEQLVSAQEDAHAATERADALAESLEIVQEELTATDGALDRTLTELWDLGRGAGSLADDANAARVQRDAAIAAARLALTFYGREHDVAVQAAEAFAQQIPVLEQQRATIDSLQDEVAEHVAALAAGVDERAELRAQVRSLQAAVRRAPKATAS